MTEVIAIALGGAMGAVARYGFTNLMGTLLGTHFPYGTLLVNIIGSLLLGVAFIFLIEKNLLPAIYRSATIVGFLGAFTTFSTFSLQALGLIQDGRLIAAFSYIFASVVICILAVSAGMFIGRSI